MNVERPLVCVRFEYALTTELIATIATSELLHESQSARPIHCTFPFNETDKYELSGLSVGIHTFQSCKLYQCSRLEYENNKCASQYLKLCFKIGHG